jgi:hypothetical protein
VPILIAAASGDTASDARANTGDAKDGGNKDPDSPFEFVCAIANTIPIVADILVAGVRRAFGFECSGCIATNFYKFSLKCKFNVGVWRNVELIMLNMKAMTSCCYIL